MPEESIPTPGETFGEADGHAAAEGMDMGQPERPFWYRALRSSSPNPPIEQVGGFQDIRDHYEAYGLRGLQKAAGVDDAEAWVDLVKFVIGVFLQMQEAQKENSADPEGPNAEEIGVVEDSLGAWDED